MGDYVFGGVPALQRQAATPVAGFILVNATPTIITWTTPNDGAMHRVIVFGEQVVTSNETGGQINVNLTDMAGNAQAIDAFFPNHTSGTYFFGGSGDGSYQLLVPANSAVSVVQQSALTGGAATAWFEIWGS